MNTIIPPSSVKKHLIAESHRRQFHGEDFQKVAHDLAERIPNPTEEEYDLLCESPEPGCDCGFCATAPWE